MLFEKQPYVAHLENPAINDVVKGGKVDSLALQKFLLATDLLQDSIQGNLDMIVTDGGSIMHLFVERSIRNFLPLWKKPNPVEVKFKDKSKFDVQNPVVGSLITQVADNKKKRKRDFESAWSSAFGKRSRYRKKFPRVKEF